MRFQVSTLLDRVSGTVSPSFFFQNLWLVLITAPNSRISALNYLSRRLPKLQNDDRAQRLVFTFFFEIELTRFLLESLRNFAHWRSRCRIDGSWFCGGTRRPADIGSARDPRFAHNDVEIERCWVQEVCNSNLSAYDGC